LSGAALVSMVIVCGVVWGGFVTLLARALRREGSKQRAAEGGDAGRP
jgi:hypothetical protein